MRSTGQLRGEIRQCHGAGFQPGPALWSPGDCLLLPFIAFACESRLAGRTSALPNDRDYSKTRAGASTLAGTNLKLLQVLNKSVDGGGWIVAFTLPRGHIVAAEEFGPPVCLALLLDDLVVDAESLAVLRDVLSHLGLSGIPVGV